MITTTDRARRLRTSTKNPTTRADGGLICRSCGSSVKRPDPARTEVMRVYGPAFASATARGIPAVPAESEVTRCDACTDRRSRAEALLAEHPRIARAHGNVALDRLDAALAALDLGGVFRHTRMVANLTSNDERLHDLIERMAPFGAAASWSASNRTEASPKRWSHVPADLATDARAEQGRLVHRLVEHPFPFAPPGSAHGALAGCLFCGVGTISVRESDAASVWGEERRIDPAVVGGRHRPEPIAGHLCPRCRFSVARVGASGMPAVERALLDHFGYTVAIGRRLDFHDNLKAWVALKPGTEPNASPWGHLGSIADDLADLHRRGFLVLKVQR